MPLFACHAEALRAERSVCAAPPVVQEVLDAQQSSDAGSERTREDPDRFPDAQARSGSSRVRSETGVRSGKWKVGEKSIIETEPTNP